MHTIEELRERQALPLELKIRLTEARVRAWVNEYGEDGCYISFSGGKDSTVLMDIIRNRMGYNIPAMFVNVPTQFPELKQFAMTWDNVDIINPKISFMQVCEKYGFPLISKEVSECVQGGRKYLATVLEELSENRGGQKDLPYAQFYRKLKGIGEYQTKEITPNEVDLIALQQGSRGGYDSKYRRVRGIGEFAKRETPIEAGRAESKTCSNARLVHEGRTDKGEYP